MNQRDLYSGYFIKGQAAGKLIGCGDDSRKAFSPRR